MLIKSQSSAIDHFTSTSGKYTSLLIEKGSDLFIMTLQGDKIRKITAIADPAQWEHGKEQMTAPAEEEEISLAEELEKLIPQIGTPTLKTVPRGPRIIVKPIAPVDEITRRAEAVGIVAIIDE